MADAICLGFTVYGQAQAAGSKRAFKHRHSGRIMVADANRKAKPWQAEIRAAAQTAMLAQSITRDGTLVDGPLRLELVFYVPRPKGHYSGAAKARGTQLLLPSAPAYPTVRPDVLKLARAVEDALTGIVYRDDAQIVRERLSKQYGEPARVEVTVQPL